MSNISKHLLKVYVVDFLDLLIQRAVSSDFLLFNHPKINIYIHKVTLDLKFNVMLKILFMKILFRLSCMDILGEMTYIYPST